MHKVTVAWGDGSTCVFVRISYVPKASKVKTLKKGEGRTETKDWICRAQVKYLVIYMLGTVHVSIQGFFYRDGNL